MTNSDHMWHQKITHLWCRFYWVGVVFLSLSGCLGPQANFELGWTTQQIQGYIQDTQGEPRVENSFILIQNYYPQFAELEENKQIYYPNAQLIFPDADGNFRIPFDLSAAKIQLSFIASGYAMENFAFQRQMGMGDITLLVEMKKIPAWQDHFFVTVAPFLQQFIIEQRFALEDAHQQFIGDWLAKESQLQTPTEQLN